VANLAVIAYFNGNVRKLMNDSSMWEW